MQTTFTFRNLTQRMSQLLAFASGVNAEMGRKLYQDAEEVMTESKERYVPVLTGALRASGHVEQPRTNGSRVSVQLGFGGSAVEYAEYVHEDLNAQHAVGQAKYLEIPLRAKLTQIERDLADAAGAAAQKVGLR
jgi:hypothetical protein